ncbi:tautomerase family protein [Serratia plymuthica]|uniref:tautomerase family protein n=1 Tax=Serratia plymuthica TaxID=82996 RepID=UPI003DA4305E
MHSNDRFVIITGHKEDELFIHPTFPDMKRSDKRTIVTVTFGSSRMAHKRSRSQPAC